MSFVPRIIVPFCALRTLHLANWQKMSAEDFGKLISENEEIRRFANKVLRLELINKTKKEVQFISNDASQRLAQFRKDFNMLENRIPHNMIATYLGISPVTLSRLRKQLSLINKC